MSRAFRECEECGKLFCPERPEQRFHDRHCARLHQARQGIPTDEDKIARITDQMAKMIREFFGSNQK